MYVVIGVLVDMFLCNNNGICEFGEIFFICEEDCLCVFNWILDDIWLECDIYDY